ncbi:MAG: fructose-6-phosphate aldolase [Alphaproteobacteria bacterium]|nr:fructose-6-phosphate aldolase [Alphaproteobacteria bacterium]
MKFFVDTADLNEIKDLAATGLLDGVTTNPSLVAKSGHSNFIELIREIASVVEGPVSAEVAATDFEGMLAEARTLTKIAKNIAIKVPLTPAGLKVCKILSGEGTQVNVTLCFSPAQAILAAKAGAAFVSPFVGRLDDIGQDGMGLISSICEIYGNYPAFKTEVLVASVRSPMHVVLAAQMGADVATIPPSVIRQLFKHPLTDSGLAQFVEDWKKTGQTIPRGSQP